MATLDVTEILHHAELVDSVVVRRRQETVGTTGRNIFTEATFSINGVVTMASPNDLERLEDYQRMSRTISIVCEFRLRGETNDYQPDIITWRGDNYIVVYIDSYPQFGAGFIQAICTSMDKTDQALDPLATGRLIANRVNSLNVRILIR